ncbi:MAG: hypothetical protein COU69_00070 [Candidatus Pacebacteria bacterium CG10_big_fil_rev_8_21_14_0_10_56_10]|nr:MAG: hypothetical protein COU69_00070 [Candidatus Pacebacteria bacterium CG10_big_fil_rev_8_21_14_0_10_56_10]
MKRLIALLIGWRLVLSAVLAVTAGLVVYRADFMYTSLWWYGQPGWPVSSDILWPWANFDGVHYLRIAAEGYTTQARFLPLWPAVIGMVTRALGVHQAYSTGQVLAAVGLSSVTALAAAAALYRLLRLDVTAATARRVVMLWAAWPVAFFLFAVYTEGLFVLLAVLSLYLARQRRWWLAGAALSLLAVTRLVGVLMVPVVLLEFWQAEGLKKLPWQSVAAAKRWRSSWQSWLGQSWPILLSPVTLVGYAWFNWWRWGSPLYFVTAHGQLGNSRTVTGVVLPVQTLVRYARLLVVLSPSQHEWRVAVLELAALVFITAGLWLMWRQRLRWSYQLYVWLAIALPLLSGTLSGLPRYTLILFPIFLAMAKWFDRWPASHGRGRSYLGGWLVISLALQAVLLALFSQGYFVG